MAFEIGVLFALGALIGWGFGDFLIQRSVRKLGDWEPLLIITAFGAVALTPFVYGEIHSLVLASDYSFLVLLGASFVIFLTAIIDFEALRIGKIAVVEPVYSLEVPVSALLAFVVIGEVLEPLHTALVVTLMIGILMVSMRSRHFSRRVWLEKGAALAALFQGTTNFMVGIASRETSFLITNWFMSLFIALVCAFYIIMHKRTHKLVQHLNENKRLLVTVSIFDNIAWIFFAAALTLTPIAIAVGISESYIALAALLGIIVNKEKLLTHQKFGLLLALLGAVTLAIVY
ncbi:MAG: DMT family transporter [Candidatus Aenigmarchaeota archaeon]|nr:DMT family transporter [Candidatus Aenigmarchaeota archaeon]